MAEEASTEETKGIRMHSEYSSNYVYLVDCTGPEVYDPYAKTCLFMVTLEPDQVKWYDAEQHCIKLGASLAIFETIESAQWLVQQLRLLVSFYSLILNNLNHVQST